MTADLNLVPLSALAAEGFGWDHPLTRTPKDAIRELAGQLRGQVVRDDLGRLAVAAPVARALLTERNEAEQRAWEAHQRNEAALAEQADAGPPAGIPADQIPAGLSAAEWLMAADRDSAPRRKSVLEDALARRDTLVYRSLADEEGA